MDSAHEVHRRARAALESSRFEAGLELLARARELTNDPDLLSRIDLTAAYAEAETGNQAQALATCEKALQRPGNSAHTEGLIHAQLGGLTMRNGDRAQAEEHFRLAIGRLADDPWETGRLLLNRGGLHLQTGEAERAAADFEASAELLAQVGDTLGHAKAVFNLGYTQLLRNDLVAAIRGMDQAGETLAAVSPVSAAIGQQDRAEVMLAAGRPGEAIAALESAAATYGEQRLRRFQAECEFVLARTLLADDPGRARAVAGQAARRFRAHGSEAWALRAEALAVIADIEGGATGKALLSRTDSLVTRLRSSGHRQDAERLVLHGARLAIRRGDLVDGAVRAARVRVSTDSPITTQILAREVRAELAAAQGQPARSRMYARRGLAELHAWQATFGSLDLQTSTVGHGRNLALLGLRGAMAEGDPAVLFEWSERARALASRVTSLRPPPDPGLAAALTELRVSDPDDVATRKALREKIRAHSWVTATGTVDDPAQLAELQQRLAIDDAALVAHIYLDGQLTALAVNAEEAVAVPLGEAAPIRAVLDRVAADLDFAAQNRSGPIAQAIRDSLRADLARLADLLIRPVLGTIGYRRLVLTPSALLAGTPWTALPGLIGRPLTIPTSATRWLELAATPPASVREVGFLAGPRLNRAEEEVRRSVASWPRAHVLTGPEADAARAGWLASRVDLLHIAGHGVHPGDHPLFSAIELADGSWFGHDIDLLPRTPSVVVLSACDLGRFTVLHGEESVGMSAVWLHAGARTVLSSPALLSDDLACEIFDGWHRMLAEGLSPADALARVCTETDDIVPFLCFGAGW